MTPQFDASQARRFLSAILAPGACFEIRLLSAQFGRDGWIEPNERFSSTLAGWYDSIDDAVADLGRLRGVSAYVTPNPVKADLLARSYNRLAKSRSTTTDEDIAEVRWLFIDIDAVRPAGISSTDEELAAAVAVRDRILANHPEIAAAAMWGCSGNGAWILERIEPTEDIEEARKLAADALAYLGAMYSTKKVKIDATTRNPARVMCVPGTLKVKGSHIPSRPHRLATIDGQNGEQS
jgi:hypothetical protein